MPHFRPENAKNTVNSPAIAALFTAISEVLYQMSGDLNGGAAHFAAIFAILGHLSGVLNGSAARFAAQILLGLKILHKSGYAVTISVFLN